MNLLTKIKAKCGDPSAAAPLKIVFLGDSVTHGGFEVIDKGEGKLDCIFDANAVFHARLKRMVETVFPGCAVAVTNAGISGGTTFLAAQRVERDVIAANPDLVVVCFGLNDVLNPGGIQQYTDGLRSVFTSLRQNKIDTIFMTPNMVCTKVTPQLQNEQLKRIASECSQAQLSGRLDSFLNAAMELCFEMEITICDCYRDWKRLYSLGADIPYLLANHINHPSRQMHQLFAARLFETIFFK